MMDRSRPHPIQLALAVAGIGLAIVGLVRLGQGRPDRHRTTAASSPTTRALSEATAEATTLAAADGANDPGTEAAPATPASGEVSVDIADFAFSPDPLDIAVGTKVTWTNKDSFAHTATATGDASAAGAAGAAGAAFDSKNLESGKSYSYVFEKAGTFSYRCAIHNSMTGAVVVK